MAPVLGTTAGAYRLLEVVATDALGTVHRAQDERTGRQVLVRLLQPLAGDPDALRRFRIELPAIAALDHHAIVRVESWGEWNGVPYVVTPFVPAHSLADLLAGGHRPDRRTAMGLLRAVAAALDHGHHSGVVHGSLEPAKVLVAADGSTKVSDFGLALVANASASGAGPDADMYALAMIATMLLGAGPGVQAVLQRRWESCSALVEALEEALAGGPAAAPAQPLETRLARLFEAQLARLRAWRWRWIAPGAGAALLLVLAVTLVTHLARPGPALAVSPTSVRPGDAVTVTGTHLPAGQPGTVVIAGRPAPAAQFTSDSRGTFSVTITVPEGSTADLEVEACWGGSCPLSQVLHVVSPPTPLPTEAPTPLVVPVTPTPPRSRTSAPSISVNHLAVQRGQTIRVTGRGFDPQQQYQVVLDQNGRVWVLQPPTSPDDSGAFGDKVQIPGDARRGEATVVACVYPSGQYAACARQPVLIVS